MDRPALSHDRAIELSRQISGFLFREAAVDLEGVSCDRLDDDGSGFEGAEEEEGGLFADSLFGDLGEAGLSGGGEFDQDGQADGALDDARCFEGSEIHQHGAFDDHASFASEIPGRRHASRGRALFFGDGVQLEGSGFLCEGGEGEEEDGDGGSPVHEIRSLGGSDACYPKAENELSMPARIPRLILRQSRSRIHYVLKGSSLSGEQSCENCNRTTSMNKASRIFAFIVLVFASWGMTFGGEPPAEVSLKEKVRMSTAIVVGVTGDAMIYDEKRYVPKRKPGVLGYGEKYVAQIRVKKVLYSSPQDVTIGGKDISISVMFGSRVLDFERLGLKDRECIFFLTSAFVDPKPDRYPFFGYTNLCVPMDQEKAVVRLIEQLR